MMRTTGNEPSTNSRHTSNSLDLAFRTLIAIFLISIAGCVRSNPRDVAFAEVTSGIVMNSGLEVEVAEAPSRLESGDVITLLIMNRSDYSISFDAGYGSRLYAYLDATGIWIEVPNLVAYQGFGEILEPRVFNLSSNWTAVVGVSPNIEGMDRPAFLRFLVIGSVIETETPTGTLSGAFVEIALDG